MDKKSTETAPRERLFFGARQLTCSATIGGLLLIAFSLVAITFLLDRFLLQIEHPILSETIPTVQTEGIENLAAEKKDPIAVQIEKLKALNLWDLEPGMDIPPVIFNTYPAGLHRVTDLKKKKKLFLNTLLPAAMTALQEIRREKKTLGGIIEKIGVRLEDLDFSSNRDGEWRHLLLADESRFIRRLAQKYRTTRAAELVDRVDVVPVSLILAQGAIESSWGSSRFSRTGNNIFGMWTWGKKGIIPARREEGLSHKVESYDSILDSARAYLLTLNRLSAYSRLRLIRRHTNDSRLIAEGLAAYSERGDEYVQEVITVIKHNDLKRYDRFNLAASQPEDVQPHSSNLEGVHDEATL